MRLTFSLGSGAKKIAMLGTLIKPILFSLFSFSPARKFFRSRAGLRCSTLSVSFPETAFVARSAGPIKVTQALGTRLPQYLNRPGTGQKQNGFASRCEDVIIAIQCHGEKRRDKIEARNVRYNLATCRPHSYFFLLRNA